jgi:cell wall-associated NlpC family hydrolase
MGSLQLFLDHATQFLGQRYRWGGGHGAQLSGPAPVDCSGLVSQAAKAAGFDGLTGSAREMQKKGVPVSMDDLKPGDLVFKGHPAHHVGIYVGNGQVLEAPHKGANVQYSSLDGYTSARRISDEVVCMPGDTGCLSAGRRSGIRMPEEDQAAS